MKEWSLSSGVKALLKTGQRVLQRSSLNSLSNPNGNPRECVSPLKLGSVEVLKKETGRTIEWVLRDGVFASLFI